MNICQHVMLQLYSFKQNNGHHWCEGHELYHSWKKNSLCLKYWQLPTEALSLGENTLLMLPFIDNEAANNKK